MSFAVSICHLSKDNAGTLVCVGVGMHLMRSVDSILFASLAALRLSTRGRCRVRVSSIKGPAGIELCHLCTALLCIVHCTLTADTLVTLEPNVTGADFARALLALTTRDFPFIYQSAFLSQFCHNSLGNCSQCCQ